MAGNILISTTLRCGSTWVSRLTKEILGCRLDYANARDHGFSILDESSPESYQNYLAAISDFDLIKTHDVPVKDFARLLELSNNLKIVTVSRNVLDVLVSRFFYTRYHRKSDQDSMVSRDFFASQSDDYALLNALPYHELGEEWIQHWKAFEREVIHERFYRISYEKLLSDKETELLRYSEFLGIQNAALIKKALNNLDFARLQRNEQNRKGLKGKYQFHRMGQSENYRYWLSPNTQDYIHKLAA